MLPNASGARTTPSWVAFTPRGRVVGDAAKAQASANPTNTLYDIKRVLGRDYFDDVVQRERKQLPFTLREGREGKVEIDVEVSGAKKTLAPEEISAMVLAELKTAAERALGVRLDKAVVTVPAHFNDQQRQATKTAGRIAGLDVRRIINEPTAAALAYGLHDGVGAVEGKNVLIFDLGGGTFDVSVLALEGGVFQVKATGGDTHLGGEDFDDLTQEWALGEFEAAHGADKTKELRGSARAMSRLRRACETAKRQLSARGATEIELESLAADVDFKCEVTRDKFDELQAPLYTRCLDTVSAVVADAKLALADISDVVLVGGSTRVPSLQTKLKELFGGASFELRKSVHPDEAVAIGAAVQGRILAKGGTGGGAALAADGGDCTDLLLLDVTPLSLGIELEGRLMSTLIKRNTAIPCRKTRTYTTVEDYQTEIDVVVYEGERPSVDACHRLGHFSISGVQRAKAGEPQVDVTFVVDANGILNVSARDQTTGAFAEATIKAEKGRLSEEEIERMVADAEKARSEDAELADKYALQNRFEEAVFSLLSKARDDGDDDGVAALEDARDWIDFEAANASLADMQKHARRIGERFDVTIV